MSMDCVQRTLDCVARHARHERRCCRRPSSVCLLALSCQTYTARPLDPDDILKKIEAQRREVPEGTVVSLQGATELMRKHNPRVKEAWAAHRTNNALADPDSR